MRIFFTSLFIIYFFYDLFTSQNERTPIKRCIEFVLL